MDSAFDFLSAYNRKAAVLWTALTDALWRQATTGSAEAQEDVARHGEAWSAFHGSAEELERVNRLFASESLDERTFRELSLVRASFLREQMPEELRGLIVRKEAELSGLFANERAEVDGKRYSANDVEKVLANSTDQEERRTVWSAAKAMGEKVAPVLVDLVEARNEAARSRNYRDYYAMSLELDEIPEDEMLGIMETIEKATREPYFAIKDRMDSAALERGLIGASGRPRPWHEADLFGARPHTVAGATAEEVLQGQDPVELTGRTYQELGLPFSGVLNRSDLYGRDGKAQHAFCISMDRGGDVRILANVEPGLKWSETMLHEGGHAVYEACIDSRLPWVLRTVPHANSTEGVAMLMGRLARNPAWIGHFTDTPPDVMRRLDEEALEAQARMLYFLRFALVMVFFERDLYEDPRQDLNELWWALVEEIQGQNPPQDGFRWHWATKTHLSTSPVYYQNYILGEATASQYLAYLLENHGRTWFRKREAGDWLRTRVFAPGAQRSWNEALRHATGQTLNPAALLAQYT